MPLSDEIAEGLLAAIIKGEYGSGTLLPPEGELGERYGASRLTVREAVKVLRAQNVVRIHHGRGTYVNPPDRWTAIEPLIRAEAAAPGGSGMVSERLLEARRLIEVGAAELAAVRSTGAHLAELAVLLGAMREAAEEHDTDAFVDADLAFHDTVVRATGNAFVPLLFEPFGRLLVDSRRETSAVPEIRAHAIDHHARILDALTARDPDGARRAMDAHLTQTAEDLRAHVIASRRGTS